MQISTIAAIATPPGFGGIGIVKLSGPKAIAIASSLFRSRKAKKQVLSPQHERRLIYGVIIDPISKSEVDEVLMAVMPGPQSYTGEDVVEIQGHGGPVVLARILRLAIQHGCEMAQPGEFTRRAFLNGRIDLSMAEGVAELIHAHNERAAQLAIQQIQGGLFQRLEGLRQSLIDWCSRMEAAIDFPEDVESTESLERLFLIIEREWEPQIKQLLADYGRWHLWRDGPSMVIVGKPNVGKSSLLNRLLGEDRAIISQQPGTTRDLIREPLMIGGMAMTLIDTAGIHRGGDSIERKGIERALAQLRSANIVLWVSDASRDEDQDDQMVREAIGERLYLKIENKCDLLSKIEILREPIKLDPWERMRVRISALHGEGIQELCNAIQRLLVEGGGLDEVCSDSVVPTLRQQQHLEGCRNALVQLKKLCRQDQKAIEIIAIELRCALQHIETIFGFDTNPEILDHIFKKFCIGK